MAMGRPTIQEVEHWRATELVEWIQRVLDPPLDPDDAEKIVPAKINGRVFLEGADDRSIFRDSGLSVGASVLLSKLAKGFASPAGNAEKIVPAKIHGGVFLEGADDRSIFRDAGLSVLSKLAKGFASPAGKLLSFILYSKH
jgi:hypothetical protein